MLIMSTSKCCRAWLCFLSFVSFSTLSTADIKTLKTSVIIPCSYKHVRHLYSLVKTYEHQTMLPDEVVISISESDKIDSTILQALDQGPWMFPVKILTSNRLQYAGENRNIGCMNAAGDIFILQDADDIPHPQRIEVIKYCFEHYEVDHLMHKFFSTHFPETEINFQIYDVALIPLGRANSFEEVWHEQNGPFTNGNVAISKKLFSEIKWTAKPRGQDTQFNSAVYASKFTNRLLVKVPLYCYRMFLSSLAC